MVQSIFEVFKISLGPSSSHTTGPMVAAREFSIALKEKGFLESLLKLEVTLFGSLAATGAGHITDKAIILGLMGYTTQSIDPYKIKSLLSEQDNSKTLNILNLKVLSFDKKRDLIFETTHEKKLFHANTLKMKALGKHQKLLFEETYYSIGGGKIISETIRNSPKKKNTTTKTPYPFSSAKDLEELGKKHKLSFAELMLKNEASYLLEENVYKKLDTIIETMEASIKKGCAATGVLPGFLRVKRRANYLYKQLTQKRSKPLAGDPTEVLDWVNLYALAVNEENASGSKIVTAPTNGAAGIIPAVLSYYKKHTTSSTKEGCYRFLLTAGAVGILYMNKASISGAEVGCQGEVGVACSMAAAGLAAALGASNIQIEKAAEIGMEHNLGLTCDPIGGLVQIPCIERNAMASIKAINASRLALVTNETSHVSLDDIIKTMYQTGLDMKTSYKETSLGGLAVNVKNC